MKFSVAFAVLAAAIVPALAAPAAEAEARGEVEKRDLSVYICERA